jgi:hypothetical protein
MPSVKYLPLLAALLVSLNASAQKKNYQVTAVAFYNFENLFDTKDDPKKFDEDFTPNGPYHYTEEIYHKKLHNLATVIKQLGTEVTPDGPALIGTAEIENDVVLNDLAAQPEIRDRNYKNVWFEGPDSRGIDVALLYNPKYFQVIAAEALKVDLREVPGSDSKSGATRDVLHVTGVLAGDTTHVFVNHWPSRRGGEAASAPLRAKAASVAKKVIDSVMALNANSRVILMGDLNDDPTSPSVAKVLGAVGKQDKVKPGGMYNPFVTYFENGIGTLGYNDSWNLFDQIMVSYGWLKADASRNWKFYKAEVYNREYLKNSFGQYKGYPHRSFDGNNWIDGYSDHFPSLVYLVREAR